MYADSNFALVDYQNMRSEASKGGDLVFTAGAQSVTVTDPKTQKPVTDKGKYLTVCRSRPTEAGRLSQTPSIRIRGRSKAVCAESPVDPHRKVRAEYVVPTDVIQDRENVF